MIVLLMWNLYEVLWIGIFLVKVVEDLVVGGFGKL